MSTSTTNVTNNSNFCYETKNFIYKTDHNAPYLFKVNKKTNKVIELDKVLPVKVQRAYDQWLEQFDCGVFFKRQVFDNVNEIVEDLVFYVNADQIEQAKSRAMEILLDWNSKETKGQNNYLYCEIYQKDIAGSFTKYIWSSENQSDPFNFLNGEREDIYSLDTLPVGQEQETLPEQESVPKKINVTCSDVKFTVGVNKAFTDTEKQALPMYFDEQPVTDQEKFELEAFVETYINISQDNSCFYESAASNRIFKSEITDDKFWVLTEAGVIYEAFRTNDQSHFVIITDKELRENPFVTTMQDNLMTGELRQAFDQWFDQDLGFEGTEPVVMTFDGTNLKQLRNERVQSESIQKIKSRMQVESKGFLPRVFKALAFPFFVFSTVILLAALAFALVQLVSSGRIPLANAILGSVNALSGNAQELVTTSASNVVNVNVNYGGQMLGANEI